MALRESTKAACAGGREMDSVGKECTSQMNYGEVLGVRAQVTTRIRMKCSNLNLVLKNKQTKRVGEPFPPMIRERSEGRAAGCLLLASPWTYRI